MFTFEVTNVKGETLSLNPSSQYVIKEISGLIPNTASIYYSDIASGDGGLFNSSRTETRNIVLMIAPEFPVEENRLRLYNFFQLGKSVDLHFKNDARNVTISGYVESFDGSLFEMRQVIQISILCLQPFFRDAQYIVNQLSQVVDNFEFPFSTEEEGIIFSYIDKTNEVVVTNKGEVNTGVIITLKASGEVVNPIIYDATNNTTFALNITMHVGDVIVINTNRGSKSVTMTTNNITSNIINSMVRGSEFFNLAPGETVFAYDCESGEEYLTIYFNHYDLYQGV